MKKLFLLSIIILNQFMVNATIVLPAVYSNHMVLQQNTKVKIWGWSEVNEKVTIKPSWDTATYFTTGNNFAKWETIINTPQAGSNYSITIKGNNNTVLIEDVLVGEVWLASGQSNMEMNMGWGLKYDDEVKNAANKQIRFFHIPRSSSQYPQEDVRAQWELCTPETMKGFSAAAYFFGEKINKQTGYPVGLISACWGGTPAEVWTPEDVVLNDKILKEAATKLNKSDGWPVLPGYAYNAMIAPLLNFKIAGTIWYQGESNTGTAATYRQLFTALINSWRKKWNDEFPFYFVQIAPYAYGNKNICPLLQEAQTQTLSVTKAGMVVTSDLVNDINDIHPKLKKKVGERLADYALADTYNKAITSFKSPQYKEIKIEKDKAIISFLYVDKNLFLKKEMPNIFFIAGDDKVFLPAQVKVDRKKILVWNKDLKTPVAVRYAFSNTAQASLFNEDGLPVNLFRTDDWEVDTSAEKK